MAYLEKTYSEIERKFQEICLEVVSLCDLELYDLEYIPRNCLLRVYIIDPKTNTATIDDCVKVDHAFTPFIEQADWIAENFILEVSSPGIFRNLLTKRHFEQALGKTIKIAMSSSKIFQNSNENRREKKWGQSIRGLLRGYNENSLIIEIESNEHIIEFEYVKQVSLDLD